MARAILSTSRVQLREHFKTLINQPPTYEQSAELFQALIWLGVPVLTTQWEGDWQWVQNNYQPHGAPSTTEVSYTSVRTRIAETAPVLEAVRRQRGDLTILALEALYIHLHIDSARHRSAIDRLLNARGLVVDDLPGLLAENTLAAVAAITAGLAPEKIRASLNLFWKNVCRTTLFTFIAENDARIFNFFALTLESGIDLPTKRPPYRVVTLPSPNRLVLQGLVLAAQYRIRNHLYVLNQFAGLLDATQKERTLECARLLGFDKARHTLAAAWGELPSHPMDGPGGCEVYFPELSGHHSLATNALAFLVHLPKSPKPKGLSRQSILGSLLGRRRKSVTLLL
ncbi:hypothetical protein IWQ60_000058 [Tieghemiomyces parasiticus]|uniref:Uncharacterized protein n=1 Tax=Tieghemiomyces parasiticus TaxID=78921 RepID=A0A9W8AJ61_9FUNG|nr:hypothetical protein IWQ60_000058 [Tieghemiomyces parasiticus]